MSIRTKVVTTPEKFKEQIAYASDSDQVTLGSTEENKIAEIFTATPNIDTEVEVSASVSTDAISQKFKLVSVSEFKYDLLTLSYDTDIIEVDRVATEGKVIFTIRALRDINLNTVVMTISYPVGAFIEMNSLTPYWSLNKLNDYTVCELITNKNLYREESYTVSIEVSFNLDRIFVGNTLNITGGGAL